MRITIPGISVTSNGAVTINSIGITQMSMLTITGESWFNDINGTGSAKNNGYIKITDDSTMQVIQGTFDNAGTIWLGAAGTYNTFMINTQVTLDGGGLIEMAAHTNNDGENSIIGETDYFNPNITLTNVDNDIAGTGEITGLDFINEAQGTLETNSPLGTGTLELLTTFVAGQEFQNYGNINADDGGTLQLVSDSGAQPFFNMGTINVASTGDATYLEIGGDVKLKGGGLLELSDSNSNFVTTNGSAATLDNIDNLIMGSGWFEDVRLKLVNGAHGSIVADNTDAALVLDTGSINNAGVLMASPGATLAIEAPLNNSGTIVANAGNVVVGGNVSGSGGAEIFSNGNIMLNGSSNQLAVTFENTSGDTGVLMLGLPGASSDGFSGTVAGLFSDGTNSDVLGLRDIAFASGVGWSFQENAGGTGGNLSVSDGAGHIADIGLLGQYLAAGGSASSGTSNLFQLSADHVTGSSGTLVSTSFHG